MLQRRSRSEIEGCGQILRQINVQNFRQFEPLFRQFGKLLSLRRATETETHFLECRLAVAVLRRFRFGSAYFGPPHSCGPLRLWEFRQLVAELLLGLDTHPASAVRNVASAADPGVAAWFVCCLAVSTVTGRPTTCGATRCSEQAVFAVPAGRPMAAFWRFRRPGIQDARKTAVRPALARRRLMQERAHDEI